MTKVLPDSIRNKLKVPLGIVVPDKQVNLATISDYVADTSCIITVGDKTTERLVEWGITPTLQIVDSQEKRQSRNPPTIPPGTVEDVCCNPPAQITTECIDKIKRALDSKTPTRLTVNGEEDLLAIPVCILAPKNSIVLYGQPNQGMVVVRVDDPIRYKAQKLFDLMN